MVVAAAAAATGFGGLSISPRPPSAVVRETCRALCRASGVIIFTNTGQDEFPFRSWRKNIKVFTSIVRTTLSDSVCDKRRLWVDAPNLAKCILPTLSHTLRPLSTYWTCKNKALMTKYPLSCRKCLVPIPGAQYRYDDTTPKNLLGSSSKQTISRLVLPPPRRVAVRELTTNSIGVELTCFVQTLKQNHEISQPHEPRCEQRRNWATAKKGRVWHCSS